MSAVARRAKALRHLCCFGRGAALAVAALGASGAAQARQPQRELGQLRVEQHAGAPAAGPVEVRAWVSRTAIWVGDRLTYTIEFSCAPNVDILQEDLGKDKLRLDGLDVLSTSVDVSPRPDGGTIQRAEYELASYRVEPPALSIGELAVRYYFRRAGVRPEESRPAGEVRVPAAIVALRSTIPDQGAVAAIRDARAAAARAPWLSWLPLAGLALLLLAVAPAGWWVAGRVRRARPSKPRDSARQRRLQHRAAFDDLRGLDPASVQELRDAYSRLDALLRDHVGRTFRLPAQALTPQEIHAALGRPDALGPGGADLQADEIRDLLQECERARYAPSGHVPDRDAWRRAVDATGTLLGERAA